MARCKTCEKFHGFKFGSPDVKLKVSDLVNDGVVSRGTVHADGRLTLDCKECGTPLWEAVKGVQVPFELKHSDGCAQVKAKKAGKKPASEKKPAGKKPGAPKKLLALDVQGVTSVDRFKNRRHMYGAAFKAAVRCPACKQQAAVAGEVEETSNAFRDL